MKGNPIPRRLSVDYISFSAHVDYTQNSEFIDQVKAQHIVCRGDFLGLHASDFSRIDTRPWRANGDGKT